MLKLVRLYFSGYVHLLWLGGEVGKLCTSNFFLVHWKENITIAVGHCDII